MDIKYMREWSLLLDIKIIIKTPLVVLTCKGAY
jgi:lipopolysaccharide/colanic/teichoic acid biosynthesis glycosyltransferase